MNWLNENSRNFLKGGYLTEGVTPEQRIKDIAETAEYILGIDGFADKFYGYMAKGYFSLSSPVWSNFGTDKGLPISCFGSNVDDTMGGILYTQAEVGMMSKFGGGTSGYFGNLRHRGAPITDNGESSGSVQHLTFLTDHEREVFKTFSEIDQYVVLDQAAIRQQFIDQSQSLNIMVNPNVSAKEINDLYLFAWRNGVKTLYYQHGTNAAQQFSKDKICMMCEA